VTRVPALISERIERIYRDQIHLLNALTFDFSFKIPAFYVGADSSRVHPKGFRGHFGGHETRCPGGTREVPLGDIPEISASGLCRLFSHPQVYLTPSGRLRAVRI
jgi:hypothetical protein